MIFKNTSWSSIALFAEGFIFNFSFVDDMDYSFNWTKHYQTSEHHSNLFSKNEWRARSWKRDL